MVPREGPCNIPVGRGKKKKQDLTTWNYPLLRVLSLFPMFLRNVKQHLKIYKWSQKNLSLAELLRLYRLESPRKKLLKPLTRTTTLIWPCETERQTLILVLHHIYVCVCVCVCMHFKGAVCSFWGEILNRKERSPLTGINKLNQQTLLILIKRENNLNLKNDYKTQFHTVVLCLFSYRKDKYFWVCIVTSLMSQILRFWVLLYSPKLHSAPLKAPTTVTPLVLWSFSLCVLRGSNSKWVYIYKKHQSSNTKCVSLCFFQLRTQFSESDLW